MPMHEPALLAELDDERSQELQAGRVDARHSAEIELEVAPERDGVHQLGLSFLHGIDTEVALPLKARSRRVATRQDRHIGILRRIAAES